MNRSSVFNPSSSPSSFLTSFYPPFHFTLSVASAALGSGNQTRQILYFPPHHLTFFLQPNVDPNRLHSLLSPLSSLFTIPFFFLFSSFFSYPVEWDLLLTAEITTLVELSPEGGSLPVLWFQLTTNNLFTSKVTHLGDSIVCVLWSIGLLVESKPRIGNILWGCAVFPSIFLKRALLTSPP